jgi:site-specific DNA recombinase
VRAIFELYLEHERIAPVLKELDRGLADQAWTTRKGKTIGGRPFDKVTLFRLLTNPAYLGKVKHKDDLYDGEHDAIVDAAIVAARRPARAQWPHRRQGREEQVRGVAEGVAALRPVRMRDDPLDSAKGPKRYRYYVCTRPRSAAGTRAPRSRCPPASWSGSSSIRSAGIGRDPSVWPRPSGRYEPRARKAIAELEREQGSLERDIARCARR